MHLCLLKSILFQEMGGNMLGWSVRTSEMNITGKFAFQPHNVLFPIELTVEKLSPTAADTKIDHIRLREAVKK